MKIAVMGYSGSGKSTLAQRLGEIYGAQVLHFDRVNFLPGWQERGREEKERITQDFLDKNDSWITDGTYSKLFFARRTREADVIILLLFNRFACLYRAFRRYLKYKNTTRPDMGEGCNEKFDREFVIWLLFGGRTKEKRDFFKKIIAEYPEKTVVLKNQRQLDRYLKEIKGE